MAKPLIHARASVTLYNFCDDDTDPTASTTVKRSTMLGERNDPPVQTAREDRPFTLRNQIDFTNDVPSAYNISVDYGAGASSVGVANIYRVLKIPKRTIVRELILGGPDTTAPTNSWTGDSGASTLLNFSATAYKSASKASVVTDLDGFGTEAVTNSGGAVAGLPTVSASTPWTATKVVGTTSSASQPAWFPYGGYVEMQFSGGASTSGVTADGAFAGTLEVQARCLKIPE